MAGNCPRLRWVQGTSAGIGGFLERTGLASTGADLHHRGRACTALRWPSSPCSGLLYFAKGMPALALAPAARRWQRHAGRQLAGSRALLVGLGGVGRAVARLLAAAGVEVTGAGRHRPQLRRARGHLVRGHRTGSTRCCPRWTRWSWPAR